MHKYELLLEGARGLPPQRIEMRASSPSAAFSWAERHAHGRKFEIFEDGRSLGSASLSRGANFWVLSPATGRSADGVPPAHEPLPAVPLGE